MKDEVKIQVYDKIGIKIKTTFTISTIYKCPHFIYYNLLFTNLLLNFLKLQND